MLGFCGDSSEEDVGDVLLPPVGAGQDPGDGWDVQGVWHEVCEVGLV